MWLAPFMQTDLKTFASELLVSGSVLQIRSSHDAVRADCKEYSENGWKIGVAPGEDQGLDPFWKMQGSLETALQDLNRERSLDFSCLLITDITRHYSLLLASGNEQILAAMDYPLKEKNLFELHGIVSRKKQLLPQLMWALSRVRKGG